MMRYFEFYRLTHSRDFNILMSFGLSSLLLQLYSCVLLYDKFYADMFFELNISFNG